MSQATPLQTMLSDVKTVLSGISDITIYDYWPPIGAKLPCISLRPIDGVQKEIGIGQQLDATTKGINISYLLQIDVWARSPHKVKEIADQVKYKLWENRGSFGTVRKDITLRSERLLTEDLKIRDKEEVHRISQTWQTAYAMTKA